MQQTREYKVLLLGPSDIGKTTFLKKILYGNNIDTNNIPTTLGVDVKPVDIHLNNDKIRLNIWDCAGNPNYQGLKEGYYTGSHAAIIFKDHTDYHKNIEINIRNKCGEIPVLYIENFDKNENITTEKNNLINFSFNNLL